MIAIGAFGKNIADTVTAKFAKGAELLQQGAQNGGNCVLQPIAFHGTQDPIFGEKSPCLSSNMFVGLHQTNMAVRRLTPIECERLQGFPDNYTNIKENCPDGARYKALGNSMAVPVMRWIGERINSYETMRSSAVVQVEAGMGLAEV